MKIKQTLDHIPGGMMVIPLLFGSCFATFSPHVDVFFGSFTFALFHGGLPILAVFYLCTGSSISVKSLPMVIQRGGVILGTKITIGILIGLVMGHLIGETPITSGWFLGLSTLALVAAVNDTNGGLYMALMTQYGSKEEAGAYVVMALESGPFLTMVSLGIAGLSAFPWQTMLGAILPLLIGIVLGNLDEELAKFLQPARLILIPFFAFSLGFGINLYHIIHAGLLGIIMGVVLVIISAGILLCVDKLAGGNGTAGIAAASTAGNAAAVPALIAAANPAYAQAAPSATVLVASCVMVSSLLVPVLTALWACRQNTSSLTPSMPYLQSHSSFVKTQNDS